jgi:hypothetical protein
MVINREGVDEAGLCMFTLVEERKRKTVGCGSFRNMERVFLVGCLFFF